MITHTNQVAAFKPVDRAKPAPAHVVHFGALKQVVAALAAAGARRQSAARIHQFGFGRS